MKKILLLLLMIPMFLVLSGFRDPNLIMGYCGWEDCPGHPWGAPQICAPTGIPSHIVFIMHGMNGGSHEFSGFRQNVLNHPTNRSIFLDIVITTNNIRMILISVH